MKKTFKRPSVAILRLMPTIALLCFISCSKNSVNNTMAPTDTTAIIVTPTPIVPTVKFGNGVNLQPSYYNNGNVTIGWGLMKQQTNIKTVRIEIEPGFVTQAKDWISQAVSNGYAVVATYHKATVLGSDDATELTTAANWWKTNYAALSASGSFTINLMNEWGDHNITASAYATAYNSAISIVRTVYNGPIIIDIPGWGQETYTAYQACKTSTPTITDTSIVLSTHIYPGNWNQGRGHTFQASDLDDLTNTGKPCIVGEFGNGTGNCDWSGCVDYAKTKKWPVLAWCWNGDGNSLNMVSPAWAVNSTATTFATSSYFSIVYPKL